jgi:hypothetical protein
MKRWQMKRQQKRRQQMRRGRDNTERQADEELPFLACSLVQLL